MLLFLQDLDSRASTLDGYYGTQWNDLVDVFSSLFDTWFLVGLIAMFKLINWCLHFLKAQLNSVSVVHDEYYSSQQAILGLVGRIFFS